MKQVRFTPPSKDWEGYERISDELRKKISAGKDHYVY
jgi:hypothetical protein